jgi:hypothetical protein
MDIIAGWAARIAEEAAPDEIDLAPAMAQAFIQGGKEREQLFLSSAGGVPGAFGPGEGMALFPWLLQAIANAGPVLLLFLASTAPLIGTFFETINNILEIRSRLGPKDKADILPDYPYAPLCFCLSPWLSKGGHSPVRWGDQTLALGPVCCGSGADPRNRSLSPR